MRKHKYLDKLKTKLGIAEKNALPHEFGADIKRCAKQRKKYGFDECEIYNMELSFFTWLYERLCAYMRWSGIKQEERDKILDKNQNIIKVNYNERVYTRYELICLLKKRLRLYFDVVLTRRKDDTEKNKRKIGEIYAIWQVLAPVLYR